MKKLISFILLAILGISVTSFVSKMITASASTTTISLNQKVLVNLTSGVLFT